jgi:hypothetical protein
MPNWSCLTLENTDQVDTLIHQAREWVAHGAPDGVGVFRAREGFALYFSPIATGAIRPFSMLQFVDCPRPDQMRVEIVVGPYDEPDWYDQSTERITEELDLIALDELGLLGPDADTGELRRQHFGREARS